MTSAWQRWREWTRQKAAEKPFVRLVGHFVNRSLRGGAESDSEELDFSTGLLLVLLPVPGIFVSIIFYDKYSTFLQWIRKDLIGKNDLNRVWLFGLAQGLQVDA